MIQARIISIDDKVIVEWPPEPEKFDIKNMVFDVQAEAWKRSVISYENYKNLFLKDSRTIAEVENAYQGKITKKWFAEIRTFFEDDKLWGVEIKKIAINQTVFIEPTENNKIKIVKI